MSTAMLDDCGENPAISSYGGPDKKLMEALGKNYVVLEHYGYEEGWGHHGYETIYQTHDGRIIFASCGGCSCGGSGSWAYEDSVEEARENISEYERERRDSSEEGPQTLSLGN